MYPLPLCVSCLPPSKDSKHGRNSPEVSRHHRSSEAFGAGSRSQQRGIWQVTSGGGEADGSSEGCRDGEIVQREENRRSREVRVKNSATFKSITGHHLGVLRKQCPSK